MEMPVDVFCQDLEMLEIERDVVGLKQHGQSRQ